MASSVWQERPERQKAVLKDGRGHFVVIVSYSTGGSV